MTSKQKFKRLEWNKDKWRVNWKLKSESTEPGDNAHCDGETRPSVLEPKKSHAAPETEVRAALGASRGRCRTHTAVTKTADPKCKDEKNQTT